MEGQWVPSTMAGSGCCLAVLGLFALQCFTVQEVLSAKVQAGNTADPGLSNANFVEHLFHSLNVAQVGFKLVSRMEDCIFACFRLVTCFSFNLEANPDIKDRLRCELLASDIYNASDKFQPNATFHHYSIFVCIPILHFLKVIYYGTHNLKYRGKHTVIHPNIHLFVQFHAMCLAMTREYQLLLKQAG